MNFKCFSVVLTVIFLCLVACQNGFRKPSSTNNAINLKSETENILSDIQDPNKFNLETCASYTTDVYNDVVAIEPTRFDAAATKEQWKIIYQNLWTIRLTLREKLTDFYKSTTVENPNLQACALKLRDGFRLSRWIEDYLAETFSDVPQDFKAGDPKNVFDKNFVPTPLRGDAPWLVVSPRYQNEPLKIRSGDIITSRGNAYTSSAIARIADVDSQFSHLAFIYVAGDGKGEEYTIEEAINNPKVLVVEAHIEVGSTIRSFKEYLKDGNARNALFRFNDYQIAHRSARWVYEYIQNYRKNSFDSDPLEPADDVNHNVPYNFLMDLDNPDKPKKLFCTQVAYVGFYSNNVVIPLFSSQMNTELSLVKRMGIKAKPGSNSKYVDLFAPGDMEVDPRFEMLAEYRNVRKLKGLRMKDMVLSSMYRMMDKGYEFTPLLTVGAKAVTGWFLRQMDVGFTKQKLPKNMSTKVMNTTFTLENVAMYLEKELASEEERYKKENSDLRMSFTQGLEFLEKVRQKDREAFISEKAPARFHWEFSIPSERPPIKRTRDYGGG